MLARRRREPQLRRFAARPGNAHAPRQHFERRRVFVPPRLVKMGKVDIRAFPPARVFDAAAVERGNENGRRRVARAQDGLGIKVQFELFRRFPFRRETVTVFFDHRLQRDPAAKFLP